MRPVALLGVSQTKHSGRRDDASYAELAFEVVSTLLEQAGLSHDHIDAVITASSDFWDGRTISDMAVQDATGAAGKSSSKVSMDGAFALAYAAARLNSGQFGTCLVVAHGKASEGYPRQIAAAAFDPIFERPLGVDDHAALGLQAQRLLYSRRIGESVLADAAARSWRVAARNPHAHRRTERSPDEIAASPMVAAPLHADEIAPDSDGACAVLLASADRLRELRSANSEAVWLDGIAMATDSHGLGDRDLGRPGVLVQAARAAYAIAGIDDPIHAIDLAEGCDLSSAQTLLWRTGLGLDAIDDARWNPSGGAMGAQPGFATGLVRVAEVFDRLSDGSGRTAVAHGMTGFVGQAHCVSILRRRKAP